MWSTLADQKMGRSVQGVREDITELMCVPAQRPLDTVQIWISCGSEHEMFAEAIQKPDGVETSPARSTLRFSQQMLLFPARSEAFVC